MKTPRREIIESLREGFPVGCRVELLKMDDPQAPPIGTLGTVIGVDAVGTIHLGLPIPEKLKSVLEQLHDRAEKEE